MLHMEQNVENDVKEIMGDLVCPKDFICYKSGFEALGKAKEITDIGLKGHFQCLEENPSLCLFSVSFSSRNICNRPVRVHIAKKLGR